MADLTDEHVLKIIHIMTENLDLAQAIIHVALSSGFRESGIMSTKSPPMLAVRTNGLSFDSIIGYWNPETQDVFYTVDDDYLCSLIDISNMRFRENDRRREHFLVGIEKALQRGDKSTKSNWEPADVRKERLRAEGLAKQAAKRAAMVDPETASSDSSSNQDQNILDLNALLAL